ncbi:HAD domain-containing protein [Rhodoferax sp.]|uniref:HAD domain-containing protein n=1 Tax=Rhodoferax sp. TaxID=50421 RepID=UPI0026100A13|nr:HAD domain-containing protein [Rhodoferax sp.]MDD2808887.1 HAD domain-containing protein [Rhodoferax sp.]
MNAAYETTPFETSQPDATQPESNPSEGTCVLFLDFDGVTHPEPCKAEHEFSQLVLIEEVLRQHPEVDIVISSSWRLQHSLDEMRAHFAPDIAPRVVGATPSNKKPSGAWLPGAAVSFEREGECDTWMKHNRPWGTPWLAIDDRAHWFRPDCGDLLMTSSKTGFMPDDVLTLKAMLQERL